MHPQFSPEAQLLLHCARHELRPQDAERARAIIRAGVDWDRLVRTARAHGQVPRVCARLEEHFRDDLAGNDWALLRTQNQRTLDRNRVLAEALPPIVGELERAGIRALAYKGPTLATLAYGDILSRPYADLDILVEERGYETARSVLLGQGFELVGRLDFQWESAFLRREDLVGVDLHKGLVHDRYGIATPFEPWYARRQWVSVAGTEVPTLSTEDTVLMLAVQVGKDGWEDDLSVVKLCDLTEIVVRRGDLDWAALLGDARRLGVERMLLVSLALARDLLGAPTPDVVARAIHRDGTVNELASRLESALFTDVRMPSTLEERLGRHYPMRERWRDRLYPLYWQWCRRVFQHNQHDREMISLPPALAPLYYLVRPVRLARKYALRGFRALTRH